MVIHEYFRRRTRRTIGFFNEDPPKEASTPLAGYTIRRINESDLVDPSQLADVAAVVFRQQLNSPNKVKRDIEKHAETLLWHDCRVFVEILPVEPGSKTQALRSLVFRAVEEARLPTTGLNQAGPASPTRSQGDRHKLTPVVYVFGFPDTWSDVAEYLQQYPPGEPPSLDLQIVDDDNNDLIIELSPEEVKLVQRAFHDCLKVTLIENSGGLSGVRAYKAYAIRKEQYVGSQTPYEYFVKIGDGERISKEYLAYREIALEHIPFHLGPRLRLDRCALGTQLGIIVSDYVSGAEKLDDCAREGRAVPVIASLFNTTLRAWRENSWKEERSLHEFLKKRMPSIVPPHRRRFIEELGGSGQPAKLWRLVERMSSKFVQVGVVHGDLHALNVLVRGRDAIVIDFEKVERNAPLLIDFASLEGGLLVSGFLGDRRNEQELLESIESLYKIEALVEHRFIPCDPSDRSAWFFDCVRQVRMQARQIELDCAQYAVALAVTLAKKACNVANFDNETEPPRQGLTAERVRALAYVLAERVLVSLTKRDA